VRIWHIHYMKKFLIIAIVIVGIGFSFDAKNVNAYTMTSVGGTFDGDYLSIPCASVPNKSLTPPSASMMKGVSTTTTLYNIDSTSGTPEDNSYDACSGYFFNGNWQIYATSSLVGLPADTYYFNIGYKNLSEAMTDIDYYYMEFTWNGTTVTSYDNAEDDSTRFSYFSPSGGSTVASSTENTIYADLQLNEDDYVDDGYVVLKYLWLSYLNSAVGSPDLLETEIVLDDTITSGLNALATTTGSLGLDGKYILTAEYRRPNSWYTGILGFLTLHTFDNTIIVSSSTIFTYGTTTAFEKTQTQWQQDNAEFMASSTASANVKEYCSFSTSFSMGLCISALFLPNKADLYISLSALKDGIGSRFPLGYATDFVTILATTSTTTLAVIDATMPSALGLGNAHIYLSLDHVLDPILEATTTIFSGSNPDTDNSETFYEITSYYWRILVYLGALLYILGRILGSHVIPNLTHKYKQT